MTDEEFEGLLEVAPEYLRPVLITAFYEPMRRDEIIKLDWSEVDLKTDPGFTRLSAKRTKGKKQGRVIPLHPRVRETLLTLPSRFKKGRVFLKDGKPFMFPALREFHRYSFCIFLKTISFQTVLK